MTASANIHSRLKLRQLALAIAIHDLGSLRKAAEATNITQPAATKALQELELNFGALLFNRSKAGMRPTVFGEILIERARFILASVSSTAQEIQDLQDGDSGEVRVGTLPSSARILVPRAIAINRRSRPKVMVRVDEGSTRQLLPGLGRGELEVVVGRIPLSHIGGEFQHEVLCTDPHDVVCRIGHPLSKLKSLTLGNLVDREWILPEEKSNVRIQFDEAFVNAGLTPPAPVLVTSSSVVRIALLSTTDMLGIVSRHTAAIIERENPLCTLDVNIITRNAPIVIVTCRHVPLPPAALMFISSLRTAAEDVGLKSALVDENQMADMA